MPSSEKVISPGVFTNEIDQSFLPAAVGDIGAALIGPTVKGPPLIPTVVNSYSEFEQIFGSTFKSGSNSFGYLTSLTARQYLKNQGTLTVIRILDSTYSQAYANVNTGYSGSSGTNIAGAYTASLSTYHGSLNGSTGNAAGVPKEIPVDSHSIATKDMPTSFRLNTIGFRF